MDDTVTTDPRPTAPPRASAGTTSPATPAAATRGRPSGTSFESLAIVGFVFGLFAIVIAVFAVGLAARAVSESSGSGGTAAGTGGNAPMTLEVTGTEFAFEPSEAEIAPGGTITLDNAGDIDHDLAVEDLTTGIVEPGATGELVLGDLDPGEYEYYCSIPGHQAAGMQGQLVVG
jgi:plastocyanin